MNRDGVAKWARAASLKTLVYFGLVDEPDSAEHDSAPSIVAPTRPLEPWRARTKATLHDELMREAGFETEYHQALARRRETRQARLRSTPVLVVRGLILALLAIFLLDVFGFVHFAPKPLAGVLSFLSVGALTEVARSLGRALLVRLLRRLPFDWEWPDEQPDEQPIRSSRGWVAP